MSLRKSIHTVAEHISKEYALLGLDLPLIEATKDLSSVPSPSSLQAPLELTRDNIAGYEFWIIETCALLDEARWMFDRATKIPPETYDHRGTLGLNLSALIRKAEALKSFTPV